MKITIWFGDKPEGDCIEYEGDYTNVTINGMIDVMRRINPREKKWKYSGMWWWKVWQTYTEYDHIVVASINKKNIFLIEYERLEDVEV